MSQEELYLSSVRRLISQSPISMWLSDEKGTLIEINEPCCKLFAVSAGDAVGVYNIFEDNMVEEQGHMEAVRAVFEKGEAAVFSIDYDCSRLPYPALTRGATVELDVTIYPIFSSDGKVTNAIVQHLDRSSYSKDALLASEKKFTLFMDNVPGAVFMKDSDGRILFMNKYLQELMGNPTSWFGKKTEELVPGPLGEEMAEADNIALKKGEISVEEQFPHPDGTMHWYNTRKFAITQTEGPPLLGGIAIDISEQKKAEADRREFERNLLESQRLESLGLLAGGIAHDFNNLLMALVGNLDLALMDIPAKSNSRYSLKEAKKAARRATELTRQMLAYAGKGRFQTTMANLSDIVDEMRGFLQTSIEKKADLSFTLADKLPLLEADVSQIQQVLMNLVINASESYENEHGVVRLKTGVEKLSASQLATMKTGIVKGKEDPLPSGTYAFIEVSDDGCGMDESVQIRIFEPFFTTKFLGRGLGMAAVLGIVKGHFGAISLKTEKSKGTTFRVYFPVGQDQAEAAANENDKKLEKGNGLILIVDDEEFVLSILDRMLTRLGYDVLTAPGGAECLSICAEKREEINCVLLDLTMPTMNGVEVLSALRNDNHTMPVVLASGYETGVEDHPYSHEGFAAFVKKPIELNELSQTLAAVLEDIKD